MSERFVKSDKMEAEGVGGDVGLPDVSPTYIAIVDAPFGVDESSTPFGKRWGNESFTLSAEHLAALNAGKTIALDVQSEYIAFVRLEKAKHDC